MFKWVGRLHVQLQRTGIEEKLMFIISSLYTIHNPGKVRGLDSDRKMHLD